MPGLIHQPFVFVGFEFSKAGVHTKLDRSLANQLSTEAVNRADEGLAERGSSRAQTCALFDVFRCAARL